MAVKKYVTKSAFRIKLLRNLFLVKLQGFPMNGSEKVHDEVCDGVYF